MTASASAIDTAMLPLLQHIFERCTAYFFVHTDDVRDMMTCQFDSFIYSAVIMPFALSLKYKVIEVASVYPQIPL